KPDATINTKAFEGNVFLDDKIKADPALSADCLAEGKRWMDKNAAEAAASLKLAGAEKQACAGLSEEALWRPILPEQVADGLRIILAIALNKDHRGEALATAR